MKVGIVGYGVVGSAIGRMVARRAQHAVVVYDRFQPALSDVTRRDAINACDLVFLAVPTPTTRGACDTSAVEECASWITAPLLIRSTVPPGTVDRLVASTGNEAIAFSPEYVGESRFHPWREEGECGFLIVGGPAFIFERCRKLYETCLDRTLQYHQTTPRTAELCKYMENCYLASKVAFVNQFFDISEALGVDFEELRRLWLADPRIGESHTIVTAERGFRGRCLPKDVAALIGALRPFGGAPLLEAILDYNRTVCERADTVDEQSADGAIPKVMAASAGDSGSCCEVGLKVVEINDEHQHAGHPVMGGGLDSQP